MLELIPAARQSAILEAVRLTFNTAQLDGITLLHGGGSSALTCEINVNQKIYALRVMGFDQPLADRITQIACLKQAASLAIAPHCYYANADTGIIITDYIASQKIIDRDYFLQDLATIVRRLHQTAVLPPVYISMFDYLNGLAADLRQYHLPNFLLTYLEKIMEVQQLLAPHLIKAPCHNDLNFDNILFDGAKTWLIDWEAAGLEDPFFDLAVVCNQFTFNDVMVDTFLISYFGQTATPYQQAKLYLMQQIAHYYYAMHFLNYAAGAGRIIIDMPVPDLYDWNLGYQHGIYNFKTADDFLLYGLVQTKYSIQTINSKQFLQAKKLLNQCQS